MRHEDELLERIRAAIPLHELVGKTVKLTRAGREYRGLSPFSNEKTPSFYVSDQFYHCFSSGKSGDLYRYLMETERLSFKEAKERAAAIAGIALPAATEADRRSSERRTRLYEALTAACSWYTAQLFGQGSSAQEAMAYLDRRGLQESTIRAWNLGYAPKSGGLLSYLRQLGFSDAELLDSGLASKASSGGLSERFRDRLMFPIEDGAGRHVISFGGRAMADGQSAKYINGPETIVFKKSSVLFGFSTSGPLTCRPDAPTRDLVLVEGYFDVISSQAAGVPAVAPLGTAIGEVHLDLLWRRSDEPIVMLDGDRAGAAAAGRFIELVLPRVRPGKSCRFAALPDGVDPDQLVRDMGIEAYIQVIDASRPLWRAAYGHINGAEAIDTPERKAAFRARLSAAVEEIGHIEVREGYRAQFASEFDRQFAVAGAGPGSVVDPANEGSVELTRPAVRDGTSETRTTCKGRPVNSPLAAALFLAGIKRPSWLRRHGISWLGRTFGDADLADLSGFVARTIEAYDRGQIEGGGDEWLERSLVENGFAEDLERIYRHAVAARAPFLKDWVDPERSYRIWAETLNGEQRLHELEQMFDEDRGRLYYDLGQEQFFRLRDERDLLRAGLASGFFWEQVERALAL